jgi:protein-disulfide isomerase
VRFQVGPLGVALICLAAISSACRGAAVADSSATDSDIDIPGLDTREFTPREKHELSRYLKEFSSPCENVAVPIAQCLVERRPCPACMPAATAIARFVREGMARDQIESLYKARFDASAVKTIPAEGSPARGPDAPLVTLVEFADFECPFCQHIAPRLDAMWEKRKASVRFVFKYMPLAVHPHGELAARAAIAADRQGKFWPMHDRLFGAGTRLDASDLDSYATALGLDIARFHADMKAPETAQRLDADRKLADELGVKGTPTLFVNGREYNTKLDLEEWLDSELAAARKGRDAEP